jgi:hypothetical protein
MNLQKAKAIALASVEKRASREYAYAILDQLPELEIEFDPNIIYRKLKSANVLHPLVFQFLDTMWDLQAAFRILDGGSPIGEGLYSSKAMRKHRAEVWTCVRREGISGLKLCLSRMEEKPRKIIEKALNEY